jgi:hypothetical protein
LGSRIPIEETKEKSEEAKERNDKDFLIFVEDQIDKMKRYSKLGDNGNITFLELNQALCNYEQIYLTLIGLYNVSNIELKRKQEEFDDWYAEKYLLIRSRENPREVSAQKWSSQKEIEMMVRKEHQFLYSAWKEDILILERKVAFLRRLLESWQSQQWILNTLSKNIQAESSASTLSDRF